MGTAWRKLTTRCFEDTCNLKDLVTGHVDVAGEVIVVVEVGGLDVDAGADRDGELGTVVGVESPQARLHRPL